MDGESLVEEVSSKIILPIPAALARDHGISRATAYRYLDEVIGLLVGRARGRARK
jgi:hypothetical protein